MKISVRTLALVSLFSLLVYLVYGLSYLPSVSHLTQSVRLLSPAFTNAFGGVVKYNVALGDCLAIPFDVLLVPHDFPDTFNAGKLAESGPPAHRMRPTGVVQECRRLGAALKSAASSILSVIYLDRDGLEMSTLKELEASQRLVAVEVFDEDVSVAITVRDLMMNQGYTPIALLHVADVVYVRSRARGDAGGEK